MLCVACVRACGVWEGTLIVASLTNVSQKVPSPFPCFNTKTGVCVLAVVSFGSFRQLSNAIAQAPGTGVLNFQCQDLAKSFPT